MTMILNIDLSYPFQQEQELCRQWILTEIKSWRLMCILYDYFNIFFSNICLWFHSEGFSFHFISTYIQHYFFLSIKYFHRWHKVCIFGHLLYNWWMYRWVYVVTSLSISYIFHRNQWHSFSELMSNLLKILVTHNMVCF